MSGGTCDLRDTPYARELATVATLCDGGQAIRLERLFVKEHGHEEIRLSWWSGQRMIPRPADLPEKDLVDLVRRGISEGVLDAKLWESLIPPGP